MKDLTGGEKILYRLLFSNDVHEFRPQFKMHIMCNDPPKVDGADEGVKRRIRKVDYISRFVDDNDVQEMEFKYRRDTSFFEELKKDDTLKMESLRLLLDYFKKEYEFQMPEVVRENSMIYLDENDGVRKFVTECIKKDEKGAFTLSEAKALFKSKDYCSPARLGNLKEGLEKELDCKSILVKKVKGKTQRNVYLGYKLVYDNDIEIEEN
jgi:phage/plasmid-associated DNA primase